MTAETLLTIAGDPKHLGAQIGATLVLHTWGSALTHRPMCMASCLAVAFPNDGERWVCWRGFFLPVRVLSRLFPALHRGLAKLHRGGELRFFGEHKELGRCRRVWSLAGAAAIRADGWCMPNVRLLVPRRCWPFVALHPSGGHLEPAPGVDGWAWRDLPLEGLPGQTHPSQRR